MSERTEDREERLLSRRDFVRSAGAIGVATVLLTVSGLQPARLFQVTTHRRTVRGLREPLTVAFLTDLHLGPHLGEDDLTRWVHSANDLGADLIVLGGDLVDHRYRGDLTELATWAARLTAPLGVHAVLGNHDHSRYARLGPLLDVLDAAGVGVLDNAAVELREDAVLAGIDDLRVGRPDLGAAMSSAAASGAAGRTSDPALLFVSHNPDVIPELTNAPDLVLAGHTHGGQVRLPLIGAVVTSSRYGRRYLEGWVDAPMPAYVSRGLGVTGVPFRYDCPAELAYLVLEPA